MNFRIVFPRTRILDVVNELVALNAETINIRHRPMDGAFIVSATIKTATLEDLQHVATRMGVIQSCADFQARVSIDSE